MKEMLWNSACLKIILRFIVLTVERFEYGIAIEAPALVPEIFHRLSVYMYI